ncbi:MAG: ATP-binding protein [Betaproteobacteria bacterium]|nr:ATP-binding protein [Betaproteobacteria bacterium]
MSTARSSIALGGPATLDRLPLLLNAVAEVCEAAGADATLRHDLRLAVEEACMNVMRHAYRSGAPGELALEVTREPWQGRPAIRVTLRDRGLPFDPLAVAAPQPAEDAEHLPLGGLGVHLMRQVTDAQAYHYDVATGNHLTLVKFLTRQHGEEK